MPAPVLRHVRPVSIWKREVPRFMTVPAALGTIALVAAFNGFFTQPAKAQPHPCDNTAPKCTATAQP